MNKFILLVLLIFVQSKKLNTFQEFNFRNLKVTEEQKEKLRNNQEFKKIAYIFYNLFSKPFDYDAILAALNAHFKRASTILKETMPDTNLYFFLIKDYTNEDITCAIEGHYEKLSSLKDYIDLFYQKEEIKDDPTLLQLVGSLFSKLIECHNS